MIQRLAHAFVRRYPLAWREPYEAGLCALIDESTLSLTDLGELTRGLLTERARELVSADNHPVRTGTIIAIKERIHSLGYRARFRQDLSEPRLA